jgi:hypothetical protein
MLMDLAERPQFRMAGRTRSSAVFRPGEPLVVNYIIGGEHVELRFATRYFDKGLQERIPGDLWLDARGSAPDLFEALSRFSNAGREIASVVALCANAAIAPIEPELIYDSRPGLAERDFFQRFVPDERLTAPSSRFVHIPATREVLAALAGHPDRERIMRALGQYSLALEHWTPGSELLTIGHLFMGAEALKTSCWRHAVRIAGKTPEALAREWGYDPARRMSVEAFLDEQARVRLVFDGDHDCHRKARHTSDAFEHGFSNPGSLFGPAGQVLVATAGQIRRAVLSLLQVSADACTVLENERYRRPRGLPKLDTYFHGTLLNAENEAGLAAPGNEYPMFRWSTELKELRYDPEKDAYIFAPTHSMTALLGDGVQVRPGRIEVWDGSSLRSPEELGGGEWPVSRQSGRAQSGSD